MPVTLKEVEFAYRLLLGREPSADENRRWLHIEDLDRLCSLFLDSAECRDRMRVAIPSLTQDRLPLDIAPNVSEQSASPQAQEQLLRHVAKTWNDLGSSEPHWSVLSADCFKASNIENSRQDFFASGRNDAALIAAILARHGLTPDQFPRMVEYGCGVGRVTPYLAAMFQRVNAIDISKSHLQLARERLSEFSPDNVSLTLARPPDFGMKAQFDLWFSYIVLQHNPPPVIGLILRRMFANLAAEGVAIFQAPSYAPGYKFDVNEYLAAPKTGAIEVHCIPQPVVFNLAHAAGCVPLEVREDRAMGYPWLSNLYVFQKQREMPA